MVPREWQRSLSPAQPDLPLPVSPPLTDLGRPFASPALPAGKDTEYYVNSFLNKFGAGIGRGVMYRDPAGQAVLISDALFKNINGDWKAMKRGREVQMERLAESIFDPDEIWGGLGRRSGRHPPPCASLYALGPRTGRVQHFLSGGASVGRASRPLIHGQVAEESPVVVIWENQRRGALIYRRGE